MHVKFPCRHYISKTIILTYLMDNMARILRPFANDNKFYERVPDKTMLFDAVPCTPTYTISLIVVRDPSAYTHPWQMWQMDKEWYKNAPTKLCMVDCKYDYHLTPVRGSKMGIFPWKRSLPISMGFGLGRTRNFFLYLQFLQDSHHSTLR